MVGGQEGPCLVPENLSLLCRGMSSTKEEYSIPLASRDDESLLIVIWHELGILRLLMS